MTRCEAFRKAHALWGDDSHTGNVTIRQKKAINRFEVGYRTRGNHALSGELRFEVITMGTGTTWEEAFERAKTAKRSK